MKPTGVDVKFYVQHYIEDPRLMDELLPMFNAWGQDVIEGDKFSLRTNRILDLWKNKTLVLILAREEETNTLTGFQIWWVYEPIYIQEKRAVSGPLYIKPEHRGTFVIPFVEYGIQAVRILGASTAILDWETDTLPPIEKALTYLGPRAKIISTHILVRE